MYVSPHDRCQPNGVSGIGLLSPFRLKAERDLLTHDTWVKIYLGAHNVFIYIYGLRCSQRNVLCILQTILFTLLQISTSSSRMENNSLAVD